MNKLLSIIVAVCLAINLLYMPIYAETEEPFKIVLETEENDSIEFNYQTIEEIIDSGSKEEKKEEDKNNEQSKSAKKEQGYDKNVEIKDEEITEKEEETKTDILKEEDESKINEENDPKESTTESTDDTNEVTEESEPDETKRIPMGEFKITYYCGCYSCSEGYGTMTSTGVRAVEGRTIAVDPTVIPYGAKVYINGHEYIAEDCGGAIKGNDIDIYLEDHDRVYEGGVDYYDVEIVLD